MRKHHCKNKETCLDQDKDADENVDADQVRTERPVECEQSTVCFTKREEIDIDFRVSGLPHADVKQAENSGVRTREEDRESSSSTSNSSRPTTSNAYNPVTEKSKMIRKMGNVELFEFCETIRNVHFSGCHSLSEPKNSDLHLWTSLERANPAKFSTNDWMLLSRTT